ncbi:unnamed protein product (macronuclear) [Paramecium tetraurelia]|uniref:Uncharacterized protein n=1 Tax=Paramecium tetraurelia TaxID=5888 RepID=A0EFX0_PARTE|nr:uncharacterized protein GSPATT00026534001 [Paramecium tetraurelia]CAK94211.1 unnamed protein product [Paramecium tetraurelia]|eukprot:XP_001461584.1 hypothetical protein (macronuclear) [Paramecium tetraurelia strain d4-2]
MLKSNKLTSESALTTNRPTSRIDSSYLNRGTSQHTQRQSTNKKYWIQINKAHEEIIDTQPYIAIEKFRKTNSCHIRVSLTLILLSHPQIGRQVPTQKINQIQMRLNNIFKKLITTMRMNHFVKRIIQNKYNNIKMRRDSTIQIQYLHNSEKKQKVEIYQMTQNLKINKNSTIKLRQEQNRLQLLSTLFNNLRQKSDNQIGFKLSRLKQQNIQPQLIYSNHLKSFRASSDYILNQMPLLPTQQISKLTEKLGNLDNYNLASERVGKPKEYCGRPQTSMKRILRRNKKFPDEQDNQLFMDESVISETEAKLNSLYGESISLQKNLIQSQKSNPIKAIQAIKKMDQIKSIINNVNANKLMNKFII